MIKLLITKFLIRIVFGSQFSGLTDTEAVSYGMGIHTQGNGGSHLRHVDSHPREGTLVECCDPTCGPGMGALPRKPPAVDGEGKRRYKRQSR